LAVALGIAHVLVVAVPFAIQSGEALLYVLFVDFPLFYAAQVLAPGLLYNNPAFNFLLFPVMGTVMYAALGYLLGRLVLVFRRR
jgi:hypothetical protein